MKYIYTTINPIHVRISVIYCSTEGSSFHVLHKILFVSQIRKMEIVCVEFGRQKSFLPTKSIAWCYSETYATIRLTLCICVNECIEWLISLCNIRLYSCGTSLSIYLYIFFLTTPGKSNHTTVTTSHKSNVKSQLQALKFSGSPTRHLILIAFHCLVWLNKLYFEHRVKKKSTLLKA